MQQHVNVSFVKPTVQNIHCSVINARYIACIPIFTNSTVIICKYKNSTVKSCTIFVILCNHVKITVPNCLPATKLSDCVYNIFYYCHLMSLHFMSTICVHIIHYYCHFLPTTKNVLVYSYIVTYKITQNAMLKSNRTILYNSLDDTHLIYNVTK